MDLERFDLPRYLSVLPLFEGLGTAALQRLGSACRLQRLGRQDMLFRVGQPCQALHVVVTGQVKLFALSTGGQEKVMQLAGPGCSFAEAPLFAGQAHLVSGQALTEVLLLTIAKDRVMAEIGADPGLALRMLASVSDCLNGLVRDVAADALDSGPQRVVGFLLRHLPSPAAHTPATVSLPASKATIASLLSVTPEYLSRVLRKLESDELIRVHKRDIQILDARRLASYRPQPGAA